jgi:DNA-nicking Smr family endonuclease
MDRTRGETLPKRRGDQRHPTLDTSDSLLGARVSATLDLHGDSATEGKARALAFLQSTSRRSSGAVVHIITGRGRNSPGGPVLKPAVRQVLKSLGPVVADFAEDVDGGGFLIRLR